MAKEITDPFCLENVKFSQCDLRNETRLSGIFKGKVAVAIKKLPLDCFDDEYWKHLTEIRDDNLVQYHQCSIKGNARYLVMDLCEGSMLDYCRKNLDDNVAKFVKAVDIMWQIICGIDYLKRHEIYHGNLKLENVLFWKRNSSSKRIVVKISGYGYKRLQNQKYFENDLYPLGCLCYSAATKEEAKPKEANLSLESLTEIEVNHRVLVLDLINLLIKDNGRKLQIATLTRHPLFIRCSEDGKSRLIKELMNEEMCQGWKSKQKLQNWKNSLKRGKNLNDNDEVFDDFIDILLLETKDVSQIVGEALRTTPKLFLGYIWYLATDFSIPDKPNQIQSIEIQELLGKGNYGKVYKCNYTDENAKRYLAACKKCNTKQEGNIDMFNREIQTLRQLNHLFVIKYLDVVEKSYKKFIVME